MLHRAVCIVYCEGVLPYMTVLEAEHQRLEANIQRMHDEMASFADRVMRSPNTAARPLVEKMATLLMNRVRLVKETRQLQNAAW